MNGSENETSTRDEKFKHQQHFLQTYLKLSSAVANKSKT